MPIGKGKRNIYRLRRGLGRGPSRLLAFRLTLGLACGLGLGMSVGSAFAATGEPILFLGIQRHTAIDRVATEQLSETLSDRGESILRASLLSDGERRCRNPDCLETLAREQRATMVLSGDVSSAGPNNTLRVQIRLYDLRRRGMADAFSEMENLCADCDETKLAILLTNTTSDLLVRYRQSAANLPPVPLPPEQRYVPPPPVVPAEIPAPPPPYGVPPPPAMPNIVPAPPPAQTSAPQIWSPPPTTQQLPYDAPPVVAPASAPVTGATPPKRGLSRNRKTVAAIFGVVGFGSLIVAAVMTGLDHRLGADYSYNPAGTACKAPENAGRSCVLSTVGVFAPLYAIGGLSVGGMILTLTLPEPHPVTVP